MRVPCFLLLAASLLLLLGACSTPARRAEERAAAFGKLSRRDQQLALGGRVHPGMTRNAVYIAWGAPDRRTESAPGKTASETWVYLREFSAYAPLGTFGQAFPAPVWQNTPFPGGFRPGFGYGGGSDTGFLRSPRVVVTDVRFKRAKFVDGRLAYTTGWRPARLLSEPVAAGSDE